MSKTKKGSENPQKTVSLNLEVYKAGFRYSIVANIILLVLLLLMTVFAYQGWHQQPIVETIATTADNRLIQIERLNVPIKSKSAIYDYVVKKMIDNFDLSHHQLPEDALRTELNFTKIGWEKWNDGISRDIVPAIINQKLFVSAAPYGAPVIVDQGTKNIVVGKTIVNTYSYKLQLPLVITYVGSDGRSNNQKSIYEIEVVREHISRHPLGLAINRATVIKNE